MWTMTPGTGASIPTALITTIIITPQDGISDSDIPTTATGTVPTTGTVTIGPGMTPTGTIPIIITTTITTTLEMTTGMATTTAATTTTISPNTWQAYAATTLLVH